MKANYASRSGKIGRLIQIGGIMVKLGIDTLETAQALQREVDSRVEVRDWPDKIASSSKPQRVDSGWPD